MKLTKEEKVQATNELLEMLADDKQNGGKGLRTTQMQGTLIFHGSYSLSLHQIVRLLRKSGKATLV